MPRIRLTLGRLMAWIAFAAVNLAVLEPFARRPVHFREHVPLGVAAVLLGILYGLAYLGYIQARDLAAILATPPPDRQKSGYLAVAALMLTLAFVIAMGLVFVSLRNIAGSRQPSW